VNAAAPSGPRLGRLAVVALALLAFALALAAGLRASGLVLVGVGVVLGLALLAVERARIVELVLTTWRCVVTAAILGRCLAIIGWARVRGRRDAGPAALRAAFEDLGPTYLKLAQLVASSHGLFPEAYCLELGKTLDRVRPFPFDDVRAILAEELGAPHTHFFARVDEEPLASASVAQVHAAQLLDGREVVCKVQRPNIATRVRADVRILRVLAELLALWPTARLANPRAIVADFERTLSEELDFLREADHLEEFNRLMATAPAPLRDQARAPRVERPLTTRRLLVMERFHGCRVDDVAELRRRGIDAEERLITGMRAWFRCLLVHGFFHGDVHAGNLMLLDDGALGFLDFGIIGRFSPETRRLVTEYLLAFAARDFPRLASLMAKMMEADAGVPVEDVDALARDLEATLGPLFGLSLAELRAGELVPQIIAVASRHGLRLPRELILVTKQMLYFDRYAKILAPRLNVFTDPRLIMSIAQDLFCE
jgi:predicted unusual protein kinase regulating ubiquinone biosynthesis (AarF/ABC1/UbiB family)